MSAQKPDDKYEFIEEELIEIKKAVQGWKKKLDKHPEGQDFITLKQYEDHLIRRLNELIWKKYKVEKGLE